MPKATEPATKAVAVEFVGDPPFGRIFYIGQHSEHRLTRKDFTNTGFEDPHADMVWNAANGWVVSVEPGEKLEWLRQWSFLKVHEAE